MAFAEAYHRQVALLIRTLPHLAPETALALKGGTAINLFVRDMPRLSVDIDLTYLPVEPRAASLAAIDAAMKRIAARIDEGIPSSKVTEGKAEGSSQAFRAGRRRANQDRGHAGLAWLHL